MMSWIDHKRGAIVNLDGEQAERMLRGKAVRPLTEDEDPDAVRTGPVSAPVPPVAPDLVLPAAADGPTPVPAKSKGAPSAA